MAATYRSSTSTNTGGSAASTLVITTPSGLQVNDVLFAAIGVDGGSGSSVTAPAGWTSLKNITQSTNTRLVIYWRLVDGLEAATYTWTFDTTRMAAGTIVAYSGGYGMMPTNVASLSNGTASTTVNSSSLNSTYETGMILHFVVTRNTTGTATITPTGSYMKREDSCTTASAFIEIEAQELAKGLTIGGTAQSSPTCSQTVTSIHASLFLEDARPTPFASIAPDEYMVGSTTASISTLTTPAGVQTNFPNEVILLFCTINKDVATISSVTGAGLTWVNAGRANTNAGSVELWRTFSAGLLTAQQFTINFSSSVVSTNYMFVGLVGADTTGTNGSGAIGALSTGTSTSAAPTISVTTTRNNSWVWGATNAAGVTGAVTVGTAQTLLRNQNDITNTAQGWMQRQNAITAASGTSVTINSTAPSTASCNTLAVEILPAVYHHLGATGAGG